MIEINWNPLPDPGPVPVNWYGLFFLLGFWAGWLLVRRWAPRYGVSRDHVDGLLTWIALGTPGSALALVQPGPRPPTAGEDRQP